MVSWRFSNKHKIKESLITRRHLRNATLQNPSHPNLATHLPPYWPPISLGVSKSGGWVAKLVACRLPRQHSGFESRHLSKIKNGRHNQRSGQHTLARKKKTLQKNILPTYFILEDMLIVEDGVPIGLRPRSVLFVQSFSGSRYKTIENILYLWWRQAQNRPEMNVLNTYPLVFTKNFPSQRNLSNTSAHQL